MIQIILAVAISALISVKITSIIYLKLYQEHLNYLEKYLKRIVLNEAIVLSILGGKDTDALLELYKKSLQELEGAVE